MQKFEQDYYLNAINFAISCYDSRITFGASHIMSLSQNLYGESKSDMIKLRHICQRV